MEVRYSKFDYKKSRARIDSILSNESEEIIEKNNKFPPESILNFKNIITSTIDVLAVDIRNSTELSEALSQNDINTNKLTNIYRAYISEVISVLKGNTYIERVYIEGDGIWAVFKVDENNTPKVYDTATRISAIVQTLNVKLRDKGYHFIEVGIGIERGKTFYVKAGYKGSGINSEVWVGNIVNKAFKLCSKANKEKIKEIVVSEKVYNRLEKKQRRNFKKDKKENIFHTDAISTQMYDEWLKYNKSSYLSCKTKKKNYCYIPIEERKRKWYKLWLGY